MVDEKLLLVGGLATVYVVAQQTKADPGVRTVYTSDGMHGTDVVDVTIRQSQSLTNANGRTPERENAFVCANVFDRLQQDYEIRIGFSPVTPPSDDASPGDGSLQWFKENMDQGNFGYVGQDGNLLLQNDNSGGVAYTDGIYSMVNASDITEEREFQDAALNSDGQHQAHYAFMHELGHLLGAGGNNSLGISWIDDEGQFHKTPTYHGNQTTPCGDSNAQRPSGQRPMLHVTYSECMRQNWNVM